METEYYSDCISKKTQSIAQHLIRLFGIGVLAIIISLSLTAKANAIYLMSDFARTGTYIDKGRYYFLDYGQYYYLDKGQYQIIGELGYYLGHPFYPRLHEKGIHQKIGFTNTINQAWFIFLAEKFPVSDYNLKSSCCFNAAEAIYRKHYYFSDMIKYNYLDKMQYSLLSTSAYSSGYPFYQKQFVGTAHPSNVAANPEPSTIAFLALGAVGMIILRKNKRNN